MKLPDERLTTRILWIFFGLAVYQSVSLLIWYWPGSLPDGPTSGVWASLAYDFSKGVFYRPLISEAGYGGTRYMPLFFVLHGFLIQIFGDPLTTGVALTLTAALLLGLGIYFVLRELGVPWRLALPFAGAVNCTISYLLDTLTIRGDFLAAAFNIWAIGFALKHHASRSKFYLVLSVTAFTCAFLTKFTSLFGLLAVSLFYFFSGHRGSAWKLLLGTGLGIVVSLTAINSISEGRALESFLACATGGLENMEPYRFILHFLSEGIRDPIFFGLFGFCLVLFVMNAKERWKEFPCLLFGATLAFTLVIYSSPGTASNHLLDLQVAIIIFLAVQFSRNRTHATGISILFFLIAGYIVLSWFPHVPSVKKFFAANQKPTRATVEYFYDRYGPQAAPVLSRHNFFSLLKGHRPVVSDFFNLFILMKKYPIIEQDFTRKIKTQYFGSFVASNWPVIFEKDVNSPDDPYFLQKVDEFHRAQREEFHEFYDLILQYYEISSVRRPFVFYVPRNKPPIAP
ncbi:MAG: hypothetical protein ACE5E9_04980 [Nitrospinaceae bacterium]